MCAKSGGPAQNQHFFYVFSTRSRVLTVCHSNLWNMRKLQRMWCWLSQVIIFVIVPECFGQRSSGTVTFLNPPESPNPDYPLRVRYLCGDTSTVHLQVLVTFDTGSVVTIFKRHWPCTAGARRIRLVLIRFPDWLVYQPDWRIPVSNWVLGCLLRAWVSRGALAERDRFPFANAVVSLTVPSPLSRPFKQHVLCPSWEAETRWRFGKNRWQCPAENEVASLVTSLYGSTGEPFGVTKTLQPYRNDLLEDLRLKAIFHPWCAFHIWVLLTQPCRDGLCGIVHHIDSKENYATPSLFLTSSGHIHVQLQGENDQSTAFLSHFTLALGSWCLLSFELRGGTMGTIAAACIDGHNQPVVDSSDHMFKMSVKLDDTDGYFVVGGGKFTKGIEGFYGPVLYYRTMIPSINMYELHLPQPIRLVNLSGWIQTCQEFKSKLNDQISDSSHTHTALRLTEGCVDVYTELMLRAGQASSRSQCDPYRPSKRFHRRLTAQVIKLLLHKYGSVDPAAVGRVLYSAVLRKLSSYRSVRVMGRLMPSLLQAGCLGHDGALHLAAVLYSSGLGVEKRPCKSWMLSLLAAQRDWRLALLRLGHLHHVGDEAVPPDPDLSYAYYSNVAKQTLADRQQPSSKQTFVESIHLNDEETLKAQTNEDDDIFHWLKLQARNGAADAEQTLGRMLFWGQQGVAPDIPTAVRHYERGAVRLQDPVSMYDYAIVLLLGQGVPQDVPRAVTFLKKAMDQGFAPAITALGWYYEQYERDYQRAAELWEQADLLENPDAAMNLGVLHLQGLYPGQPADKVKAYTYFLKSAQRGHMNGGIELAEMWSRGIPGLVARRPVDAVLWAKWASEHNGYLGLVLRKGLNAYLKGKWFMALVYYLMCAECGFEAAQFNTAFLCEHSPTGSLNSSFVTQCMLQYYNLSIQNQNPTPYALVRLGDLLYEQHSMVRRDLSDAAEMYKRAALLNDPQGWYSLGVLVQQGHRLSATLLSDLDLQQHYFADKRTLLTALYQRCRESGSDESYIPCTLALLASHWHYLQEQGPATVQLVSALVIVIATVSFFKLVPAFLRQRSASSRRTSEDNPPENGRPQELPTEQEAPPAV
ncbi:protein sel-1 homolog 3 [Brachyhypopomus gauderio]|uniref:protein sel-1 homolog 3 n=1 Tax=Brachyhypopomus gauderio TaxID=698409 RepID=UPI00404334CF